MANFIHTGCDSINLDHVCSARWNGDKVTVCLDSGAAIVLDGECAEHFAVATGNKKAVEAEHKKEAKELAKAEKH